MAPVARSPSSPQANAEDEDGKSAESAQIVRPTEKSHLETP